MRRETCQKRSATIAVLDTRDSGHWQTPDPREEPLDDPTERQVSQHYSSEKKCKIALKATESRLAKRYPDLFPLVGSANNIAK